MVRELPNALLSSRHLPQEQAHWEDLEEFAQTFGGFGYFGIDGGAVAAARARKLHSHGLLDLASTSELRNLLFFTQRAVRHVGYGVGESDLRMVHDVVEVLRGRLQDEPLSEATDDDLAAPLAGTPLPASWFGAMLDGLVLARKDRRWP